ncbi:MAG: alanine:cation symporter family protein [Saprospiraceae bacterium]|nr:alanine:cation symporter family protein [Saprospiraceae bacterium]
MRKSFFKFLTVFTLSLVIFNTAFSQTNPIQIDSTKVDAQEEKGLGTRINDAFVPIVNGLGSVLFLDPFSKSGIYDPVIYNEDGKPMLDNKGNPLTSPIPFIVVWLILGALFFTIFMKFINIKGFSHAIALIRGKFDKPDDKGEVSHFQALSTALSATVGLGNIAGVAIAIALGGPGATFWMIIAGLLGMSSKFVECTLGVKYRNIDKDGVVSGGPMYYLSKGLKKYKMGGFGAVLAVIFAILVIGASFGGGNMFQANQAFMQMTNMFPSLEGQGLWFGLVIAILVGVVIIGGIKSIARVTDKIVPFMAILYVVAALVIIIISYKQLGHAFSLIYYGAFAPGAIKGGIIGVLIMGFRRAAFSNEAGVGSAAIAHSAVKTDEPISEGIVALLEPFIDTVVICTMTALVIVITGQYTSFSGDTSSAAGVQLTSAAFGSIISWFPYVLTLAVLLFAFSTMISWSYYGLKGFDFLFGKAFEKLFGNRKIANTVYRLIFLAFVIIGTCSNMESVVDFSDMMILCMAFPNIMGLIILAPEVKRDLKSYFARIKSGEIKKYK